MVTVKFFCHSDSKKLGHCVTLKLKQSVLVLERQCYSLNSGRLRLDLKGRF